MRHLKTLTLILAGFAVAGCATISEETCLAGNWEKLGFEDASSGRSSDRFGTIVKDCGKHDITADRVSYMTGYDTGLPLHCTYDIGLALGERGEGRLTECSTLANTGANTGYEQGHEDGLEAYRIRRDYQALLDSYDKRVNKIEKLEAQLLDDDTLTDEAKADIRREIRLLDGERVDLRVDIRTYEVDFGLPRADLD